MMAAQGVYAEQQRAWPLAWVQTLAAAMFPSCAFLPWSLLVFVLSTVTGIMLADIFGGALGTRGA